MADTVPAQSSASQGQQATAASSVDVLSQLVSSARDADARSAEATRLASVPVAGGHTQPQNLVMPGAGRQYKQFQLDNSPVVGKHNATMQGIANLSKSVANVVGQVQQQQDQKKTQQLSVNIEHLMGAVNSVDQAKQVLAQDPNNAAAKEQLQKSQAIMDEVLSDDKNRKAIAKAFQINFVDPSKNNTPEHAAMKMATDSYAKQFQEKLPQGMAPNQTAIAQAQTAAAEAKATHDLVGKIAPAILAAQSREQVAQTAATQRAETAKAHDQQLFNIATAVAQKRYDAVVAGANIHARAMFSAVRDRDNTLIKTAQMHLDAAAGINPGSTKYQQQLQKDFDSIGKTLEKYPDQISKWEQLRTNAAPEVKADYDKKIQFLESQSNILQLQQAAIAKQLAGQGKVGTVGSDAQPLTGDTGEGPGYIDDSDNDSSDNDAGDAQDN